MNLRKIFLSHMYSNFMSRWQYPWTFHMLSCLKVVIPTFIDRKIPESRTNWGLLSSYLAGLLPKFQPLNIFLSTLILLIKGFIHMGCYHQSPVSMITLAPGPGPISLVPSWIPLLTLSPTLLDVEYHDESINTRPLFAFISHHRITCCYYFEMIFEIYKIVRVTISFIFGIILHKFDLCMMPGDWVIL